MVCASAMRAAKRAQLGDSDLQVSGVADCHHVPCIFLMNVDIYPGVRRTLALCTSTCAELIRLFGMPNARQRFLRFYFPAAVLGSMTYGMQARFLPPGTPCLPF